MVEEAGGRVTSIYGDADFMQKPVSIVAANPIIHEKMLDVFANIREQRTE
jgi:fructose-1,6-bisphosphatase/inositol monophosphatase family enzyme